VKIVPVADIDAGTVEALLDRAFGPDRLRRTAYLLRAGTQPIAPLSLATVENDQVIGTIQCWPVELTGDDGLVTPMILVGPVAVEPTRQQAGIGRLLMEAMLAVDPRMIVGGDAMMLIGDPEYYGRFFGFVADRTGKWRLPGPFERRRLLARGDAVPIGAGLVAPRIALAAVTG
jgi:predicted N-acetyltransferase YhbS